MPAKKIIEEVGSTWPVIGSSIATVTAGPSPGSTPIAVPSTQPTKAHSRLTGVAAVAKEAIARARSGEGPSLIECKTYRWRGHSKSDRNLYRSKEEIEEWRNQDPIRRLEDELKAHDRFDAATLMKLEEDAQRDIDAAVEFARACPDPDPKDLTRDVYAL